MDIPKSGVGKPTTTVALGEFLTYEVNLVIDYIIESASKLSKAGQVFRTVIKSE